MTIIKWTLPLFVLIFLSCKLTKNTSGNKRNKTIACSGIEIANPHFDWIIEKDSALQGYTESPLPAHYKVYTLDTAQLHGLFAYIKAHPSDTTLRISVPLPEPLGCRVFVIPTIRIKTSADNSSDFFGIWGHDEEKTANAIKISYDSKSMRLFANVKWDTSFYTVASVFYKDKTYYTVFLRTDNAVRNVAPRPMRANPKRYTPTFDK